jgi:hypothetical protein
VEHAAKMLNGTVGIDNFFRVKELGEKTSTNILRFINDKRGFLFYFLKNYCKNSDSEYKFPKFKNILQGESKD